MSAAKKLEMLPEEKYIQDALRDGRAFRTEISLKAIGKPDPRFQARVDPLDLDHVGRLGRILEETGSLHPLVVFYNPKTKKYLVADGFHRFDAYRRAGRSAVPAYQIEGDERDALEYCTMCNRLAMKGRTKEDVHKAIEMLLNDETWWLRGDTWIGDHIGCSHSPVAKVRARMVASGRSEPMEVVRRDGTPVPYRKPRCEHQPKARPNKKGHWQAVFQGKHIYSASRQVADDAVASIVLESESRKRSLARDNLRAFLGRRGFEVAFTGSDMSRQYSLSAWHRSGLVCAPCDLESGESLPDAIGRLVAARQHKEVGARAVVLCHQSDISESLAKLIDLYRAAGYEFMTPEELADSLKAS